MICLCPSCGKESEWEFLKRPEIFEVRGENIEIENELYRCGNCGTEFLDMNSKFDPFDLAYREYRKRKGMIQPEQIKDFRKKYGISQKELSILLGLGEVSLSRYENGSLQDEVHDTLLQLAMDPINLHKMILENKSIFSAPKLDSILNVLKSESLFDLFHIQFFSEDEQSIFTGNKPIDLEKIVNVFRFFTYQKQIVKSKLLKLLFYGDFKNFKSIAVSITGMKYAHLPYGPVPNEYERLIGYVLEKDQSITIEAQQIGDYIGEFFISSSACNLNLFSRGEIENLQAIDAFFSGMTAKATEEYSHKEEAYQKTKNGQLISYEFAKTLTL